MIDSASIFFPILTSSNDSLLSNTQSDSERLRKLSLHIQTDDYFLFLSTLLGFVEETLLNGGATRELISIQLEAVKSARNDLQDLHNHCYIEIRPDDPVYATL